MSSYTPPPGSHDPLALAHAAAGAERARAELNRRLAADRRRRILFLVVLIVAAGAAWWWLRPRPVSTPLTVWERPVAADTKVTGPTLGVSPNGRWFAMAWAEGPRLWWMRGARDTRGQLQFDAPVELSDRDHAFAAFDEDPPKAAVDDDGQVAVAWMTRPTGRDDGSVIAVARPNLDRDGANAITRIEGADPKGFLLCEAIQYDDDGGLLAVWIDGGPAEASESEQGVLQCATAPTQGSFEAVTTIADSVCACCRTSIAWLGPDTFALSWRGVAAGNVRDVRYGVLHEKGVDGSGTPGLAEDSRATVRQDGWAIDGCPAHGPVVAAVGENAAYVAWYTEGTPAGLSLARIAPSHGIDGTRWRTQQTYAVDPRAKAAFPYVVTLGSGRPFVVFEGPTPEGGRALYARRMTRKGLTPAQRFTTATRVARPVAVRWSGNGALVAWQESDERGGRMVLAEWTGL